jgi:NAD(P)-dependent dehydrogenase (short-subunit alcohol dehydrogenase family)
MVALSPSIHRVALDVTKDDSVAAAVETVIREQGRIDVLVNNAGLSRNGAWRSHSPSAVLIV